jgi:nucleotide-binding universal stress UspA family protein
MNVPLPEKAPDRALPIKQIVVAVYLSPRSEATARYALGIARALGASLVLVHVYPVTEVNEFMTEEDYRALARQRQAAQAALTKLTRTLQADYPACEERFLIGEPAEQVAWLARDINADLIVMGSHRPSLLVRLFNVDQAPHIVHRAPCPVLVYHPKENR